MFLGTFVQQPADNLDYDIDYSEWLPEGDSVASATVAIDRAGLTVLAPLVIFSGTALKLWVRNGIAGTYKASITMLTTLGRIKQDEIRFKVKDY